MHTPSWVLVRSTTKQWLDCWIWHTSGNTLLAGAPNSSLYMGHTVTPSRSPNIPTCYAKTSTRGGGAKQDYSISFPIAEDLAISRDLIGISFQIQDHFPPTQWYHSIFALTLRRESFSSTLDAFWGHLKVYCYIWLCLAMWQFMLVGDQMRQNLGLFF